MKDELFSKALDKLLAAQIKAAQLEIIDKVLLICHYYTVSGKIQVAQTAVEIFDKVLALKDEEA